MVETGKHAQEPLRPHRWPARWVRDESFWRSVIGEALGAVIAALVIYVFLLAGGYVRRPEVWPVVLTVSLVAVILSLFLWTTRRRSERRRREWDELMKQAGDDLAAQRRQLGKILRQESESIRRHLRRLRILLVITAIVGLAVSAYEIWA